jgi:hypothetical protein
MTKGGLMAHGENAVRWEWVAAAAAGLLLVTGCGSAGDDEPDQPKSSATQSKEETGRATAEHGALDAYRGMWDAQVEAYASGSMENAKLGDYTTGDAATNIISAFDYYTQKGLTLKGKPVLEPKVTAVDVKSDPYTATISDCVDTTDYVLVDRATGKPATVDKEDARRPLTAKATTA